MKPVVRMRSRTELFPVEAYLIAIAKSSVALMGLSSVPPFLDEFRFKFDLAHTFVWDEEQPFYGMKNEQSLEKARNVSHSTACAERLFCTFITTAPVIKLCAL